MGKPIPRDDKLLVDEVRIQLFKGSNSTQARKDSKFILDVLRKCWLQTSDLQQDSWYKSPEWKACVTSTIDYRKRKAQANAQANARAQANAQAPPEPGTLAYVITHPILYQAQHQQICTHSSQPTTTNKSNKRPKFEWRDPEYYLNQAYKVWMLMSESSMGLSFGAISKTALLKVADTNISNTQLEGLDILPKASVVIVDEAQDLNECQLATVLILLKRKVIKAVLLVGDPSQRIYSFRGASEKSLQAEAIQKLSGCQPRTFYLSNSFRFGREIAEVRQT